MKKIKLGILEQLIVQKNKTAKQAIDETTNTVKLAEELGYSRFWVSEHHNSTFIAGSAPEILMVKLAEVTKNISTYAKLILYFIPTKDKILSI